MNAGSLSNITAETVHSQLKRLKLSSLSSNLEEILTTASAAKMTPLEVLNYALSFEVRCREEKRVRLGMTTVFVKPSFRESKKIPNSVRPHLGLCPSPPDSGELSTVALPVLCVSFSGLSQASGIISQLRRASGCTHLCG